MKKLLPFVFPTLSLLIVVFLSFRWYNARTQRGELTPFADNVAIESISPEEELGKIVGVGDFKTLDMTSLKDGAEGQVRYEIKDGKVRFTVLAGLAEGEGYQVWLQDVNSEAIRKAFDLEFKKGGYSGSAAISTEVLPFRILVSQGAVKVGQKDNVLLEAVMNNENCGEEDCVINIDELTK